MTTDILDLPGWTVLAKRLEDREYELEAEYTVKPTACQKCGVLDRLYRHGFNRPGGYRRKYSLPDVRSAARCASIRLRNAWELIDPSEKTNNVRVL